MNEDNGDEKQGPCTIDHDAEERISTTCHQLELCRVAILELTTRITALDGAVHQRMFESSRPSRVSTRNSEK